MAVTKPYSIQNQLRVVEVLIVAQRPIDSIQASNGTLKSSFYRCPFFGSIFFEGGRCDRPWSWTLNGDKARWLQLCRFHGIYYRDFVENTALNIPSGELT